MKVIFTSLIAGTLVFSPLGKASEASLSISEEGLKIECALTNLTEQFSQTRDTVSEYSKGNKDVMDAYNLFFFHLNECCCSEA